MEGSTCGEIEIVLVKEFFQIDESDRDDVYLSTANFVGEVNAEQSVINFGQVQSIGIVGLREGEMGVTNVRFIIQIAGCSDQIIFLYYF